MWLWHDISKMESYNRKVSSERSHLCVIMAWFIAKLESQLQMWSLRGERQKVDGQLAKDIPNTWDCETVQQLCGGAPFPWSSAQGIPYGALRTGSHFCCWNSGAVILHLWHAPCCTEALIINFFFLPCQPTWMRDCRIESGHLTYLSMHRAQVESILCALAIGLTVHWPLIICLIQIMTIECRLLPLKMIVAFQFLFNGWTVQEKVSLDGMSFPSIS